jgi:hypothetical protein
MLEEQDRRSTASQRHQSRLGEMAVALFKLHLTLALLCDLQEYVIAFWLSRLGRVSIMLLLSFILSNLRLFLKYNSLWTVIIQANSDLLIIIERWVYIFIPV